MKVFKLCKLLRNVLNFTCTFDANTCVVLMVHCAISLLFTQQARPKIIGHLEKQKTTLIEKNDHHNHIYD